MDVGDIAHDYEAHVPPQVQVGAPPKPKHTSTLRSNCARTFAGQLQSGASAASGEEMAAIAMGVEEMVEHYRSVLTALRKLQRTDRESNEGKGTGADKDNHDSHACEAKNGDELDSCRRMVVRTLHHLYASLRPEDQFHGAESPMAFHRTRARAQQPTTRAQQPTTTPLSLGPHGHGHSDLGGSRAQLQQHRSDSKCHVCFCELAARTRTTHAQSRAPMRHCGHDRVCGECFAQYVSVRVRDGDVLPWLRCPEAHCRAPLHVSDLSRAAVDTECLLRLAQAHMQKTLARSQRWVACRRDCDSDSDSGNGAVRPSGNYKCAFGFLLSAREVQVQVQGEAEAEAEAEAELAVAAAAQTPSQSPAIRPHGGGRKKGTSRSSGSGNGDGNDADIEIEHSRTRDSARDGARDQCARDSARTHSGDVSDSVRSCGLCGLEQKVSASRCADRELELELDPAFQEMVRSGVLRGCPQCRQWVLKEFGICNVIECGRCGVWFNWETRETGSSSSELKGRARRGGTLWGAGELQYQMRLQREDPEAFRQLLERNGIRYDPNYRRGGW